MKKLSALLLLALPAVAAVTGTVVNRTTGLPLAGATVVLNSLGQNGVEPVGETRSDAQGRFVFDRELPGPGMIRASFGGVAFFRMLEPGAPTAGLALEVYASSKQPGDVKVSKHMLFFEPSPAGQMAIQDTYIFTNPGKTVWNDPGRGELHFYLPAAAGGKVQVNATAPGGMPIPAELAATSEADIKAVDFAIKPGETRFDVTYTVPYTPGEPYEGKVVTRDENTYLIAPRGVTLSGAGLTDLGPEPRTQAHLFGLDGATYRIALMVEEQPDNGPPIEVIPPRIYGSVVPILGLALAALSVGFARLYRRSPVQQAPSKEANERGRG